jgi:adenine-specific DNA methylase
MPAAWSAPGGLRAIEEESFPFEELSDIAEAESWRKEIHRPIYYVHKWWARRLGTVFRAIVAAALAPAGSNVMGLVYGKTRFPGTIVFDPFMGSGVTVGEALKLGARAIGRDINPVAHFLVRNALAKHDRNAVLAAFHKLRRDTAPQIERWYKAKLPDGREGETLYYFWVKQLRCPSCGSGVDLFSSRIFSQHAYPKRYPRAQAVCPGCGEINEVRFDTTESTCRTCETSFDPQAGSVRGKHARCQSCSHEFSIAKAVRNLAGPPDHRIYAKLVLTPAGEKIYLRADGFDCALYAEAGAALASRENPFPLAAIAPGYNTDQALGYNYRYWHQFFNSRQLLCLSILADGIRAIEDGPTRELMVCLFSGTLEFNNMFASFKGEGTGAVRHMFSHHILKPERVPLEANLWGTPASSGSFSSLFDSRILRALNYADAPTEIRIGRESGRAEKIAALSDPMGLKPATTFAEFRTGEERLYLSSGDSAQTDLDDLVVDTVVTDPPFFDNVHYSQLADFFHVWQCHMRGASGSKVSETTRSQSEVQDENVNAFARKLGNVLSECRRVLKPEGVVAFSYHHSREEGWTSVLSALMHSGFQITAAHPVKAEMSVAHPKALAKEPIDLDIILVCRKRSPVDIECVDKRGLWCTATKVAANQIARLRGHGRRLSRNDVRIILMAQVLRGLSRIGTIEAAMSLLAESDVDARINRLHRVASEDNPARQVQGHDRFDLAGK